METEELIGKQAKTHKIEGSSAANVTRQDWKGTGRRRIGKKKIVEKIGFGEWHPLDAACLELTMKTSSKFI